MQSTIRKVDFVFCDLHVFRNILIADCSQRIKCYLFPQINFEGKFSSFNFGCFHFVDEFSEFCHFVFMKFFEEDGSEVSWLIITEDYIFGFQIRIWPDFFIEKSLCTNSLIFLIQSHNLRIERFIFLLCKILFFYNLIYLEF